MLRVFVLFEPLDCQSIITFRANSVVRLLAGRHVSKARVVKNEDMDVRLLAFSAELLLDAEGLCERRHKEIVHELGVEASPVDGVTRS